MWGNDYFAKEYADSEELTVFYEQANGQLWFAHITFETTHRHTQTQTPPHSYSHSNNRRVKASPSDLAFHPA
jgi:hypothetical protein